MDYWNAFVKESEHKHGEGEDTSKCANCEAGRLAEDLTEFEIFSLAWFRSNVSQFTFDAGLIGELVNELELKDITRRLFLREMAMIYANDMNISQAKARKEARK